MFSVFSANIQYAAFTNGVGQLGVGADLAPGLATIIAFGYYPGTDASLLVTAIQ